ncbi:hypothetical protein AHAS_Ahas16G0080600 [Arachis hypogaea]
MYSSFFIEVDPFKCDCFLPQPFTMHHIHQISSQVVFTDSGSNYMDISVQRRDSKLYFTEGWLNLLTYYDQPNGMWVKLVFLGGARFFIEKLFSRSFVGQVQVPSCNTLPHKALHLGCKTEVVWYYNL